MQADFFSWEYLGTVAGASMLTWMIAAVVRYLAGVSPRWVSLATAVVVQGLAWWANGPHVAQALVLALINAVVVFFAAAGINDTLASRQSMPEARGVEPQEKRFIQRW